MLIAKVFDFRNGKSYFFLEQLLTASPVRTAGLENPNIAVKRSKKERRASQLRLLRALPNDCFLGPIPQLGQNEEARATSGGSGGARPLMDCIGDKDTELECKLPALTTPRGWGGRAMQGGSFLLVLSKHKTPAVGRGKSTEGEKCFR